MRKPASGSVAAGIAAGVGGGMLGAWAMSLAQSAIRGGAEAAGIPQPPGERSEKNEPKERGENPTSEFYERVAAPDRAISGREKEAAGTAVHLAFGGLAGGLYGGAAAAYPAVAAGHGLPFGAAVWLFANELGLAAAGLTKPPQRYTPATHAFALASHLVYGAVTDTVVRLALAATSERPGNG